MERIQLVQEALREIQGRHPDFFNPVTHNVSLDMYLDIALNKNKDWWNVTIKENSGLPPNIAAEVRTTFILRN